MGGQYGPPVARPFSYQYESTTGEFTRTGPDDVETLDFKDENTLVAFTHGRGTFLTPLDQCEEPVIPTVSEWGILCMALLIVGSAAFILGRRKDVVSENAV